jgi:hypothetical protein
MARARSSVHDEPGGEFTFMANKPADLKDLNMKAGTADMLKCRPRALCYYSILLFLLFSITTKPFAGQISSRVLEPRFLKNKSFVQTYTCTALFDDTTFIQSQFTLTNLGISNQNAACKILVFRKAACPLCWNKKYCRNEWRYAADSMQSLEIGPNQILIQGGKTIICVDNAKIKFNITFGCIPEVVTPPYASITANGRFFDYAILIRWARIQAVLEQPGNHPETLNGYGMLELSRSTLFPSDMCRGWITFRGYADAASCFQANLRLPRDDKTPATGWIWRGSDPRPRTITDLLFESEEPKTGRNRIVIRQIVAPDTSFMIDPQRLLYRYSFIDELGPVLGLIVKLVIGDPVTYYFEANARIGKDAPDIPGFLEFMRIE